MDGCIDSSVVDRNSMVLPVVEMTSDSDVEAAGFVGAVVIGVGAKVLGVLSESVCAKVYDVLLMSNGVDLCISEKNIGTHELVGR